MLNRFKNFCFRELDLKPESRILLAVSGGLDSMVMLDLFEKTGLTIAVAHANFGLRKKESDGDEKFVKNYCKHKKIPFYSTTFETQKYVAANKVSVQMAARSLRYSWFNELLVDLQFELVATAHHKSDNLETFLINIIRGSGLDGMQGIVPKKDFIIRPLLFANREEIEKYALKNEIQFREDSSNASEKYLRNHFRLKIIPQLKKINPDLENNVMEMTERNRGYELILKKELRQANLLEERQGKQVISIEKLRKNPAAKVLLYETLKPLGFNYSTCSQLFIAINAEPGLIFLSNSHKILKDREFLIISELHENVAQPIIQISSLNKEIETDTGWITFEIRKASEVKISKIKSIAYFDADTIKFPIQLRIWKPGDAFQPFGSSNKKKLSDFYTDEKMSIDDKQRQLLLCSNGKIAWVVNRRPDNRFKVKATTKKVLVCKWNKKP